MALKKSGKFNNELFNNESHCQEQFDHFFRLNFEGAHEYFLSH